MTDEINASSSTHDNPDDDPSESSVDVGPELVQIQADKKEIQRRIVAFMARKRKEADELNIQEFCNLPRAEMASEYSCARVDAVMVHRAGGKGHLKVSRAVNQWGPQTIPTKLSDLSGDQSENNSEMVAQLPEGIEERLRNMESHLELKPGNPVPKNIYERLKNLEDRILFLESLSPDYFVNLPRKIFKSDKLRDQRNVKSADETMTLDEINARIGVLQENLLNRSTATM